MFFSQAQRTENPIVWADLEQIVAEHCHWDFYRNQTVFVTGGGGLLASYLVRSLLLANDCLDLNVRVTCLLRSVLSPGSRLEPWLHHSNLSLVYGSAESYPYNQLETQNIVVHAASSASPRAYSHDPVGILLPNSVGTAQLCDQAMKCCLLYTSDAADE